MKRTKLNEAISITGIIVTSAWLAHYFDTIWTLPEPFNIIGLIVVSLFILVVVRFLIL